MVKTQQHLTVKEFLLTKWTQKHHSLTAQFEDEPEFTEEEAPFAGREVDLSDESLAIFDAASLSVINDVFAN